MHWLMVVPRLLRVSSTACSKSSLKSLGFVAIEVTVRKLRRIVFKVNLLVKL